MSSSSPVPLDRRRALIADSAIEIVAHQGLRALTHRAIDAHAELPAGSTSYYCRTRKQLLELAAKRLGSHLFQVNSQLDIVNLDHRDVPKLARSFSEHIIQLTTTHRDHVVARSALMLELTGTPEGDYLTHCLFPTDQLTELFSADGVKYIDTTVRTVQSLLEGLLWELTTGKHLRETLAAPPDVSHVEYALEPLLKNLERRAGIFGIRL